jgi:hypothetical protein
MLKGGVMKTHGFLLLAVVVLALVGTPAGVDGSEGSTRQAKAVVAAGAERLPAKCYANIWNGIGSLNVGVWTPEYPKYWDVSPPVGAWAIASGDATFTPSGRVNVRCVDSPSVLSLDAQWPSGTFKGSTSCMTARGGDDLGNGAKVYEGRAKVTTTKNGHVTITCHAEYAYTYQSP